LAKDLVMHIVKTIGTEGALGMAVELCGQAISELSMEGRMTLCNMMVEAGARAALIAPDQTTLTYLSGVVTKDDLAKIVQNHLHWHSDLHAHFERSVTLFANNLSPIVSWGTSPDQAIGVQDNIPHPNSFETKHQRDASQRALEYMGLNHGQTLQGLPVSRVFIGSCTNGRIEDLRSAAAILKGRHVHPNVRTMVVPGSGRVRRQAEAEGLHEIFLEAGCEWRQPGCSMCLAMNDDVLAPQERCASTTNRNFEGRQGRAGRTHLMSPAMAAAAALAGHITDVRELINEGK
jgi:3-isopropylmalate/(R)-2-methylmalate dehydratase large subunit